MKKLDKVIIISILLIAVIFFGVIKYRENNMKKNSNTLYAHVYVEEKLYKVINISDNHSEKIVVETDLGKNIIYIHDNGIEVVEANCDDHICKKMGFKREPGEIIVCLPNQVFIEIKGNQEADVDEVSK